jgi:hypothetical protein
MSGSIEKRLTQFFRSRSKAGGRRWGCPGEAEIAAYADHAITGRERDKIEAHLADCEFCLSQVAFLVRMEKGELPAAVAGPLLSRAQDLVGARTRVTLIPVWGRVAAATACLAVVVTVSVRYWHFRSPSSGANAPPSSVGMPSGGAGEVRGAAETAPLTVVFPAPASVVARKALQFRWKTVDGALDYDVRLLTAEGDQVWDQKTEGNSIQLPSDIRVQTGHRYYLLIRADLPEGKTVDSRAVAFSVAE